MSGGWVDGDVAVCGVVVADTGGVGWWVAVVGGGGVCVKGQHWGSLGKKHPTNLYNSRPK